MPTALKLFNDDDTVLSRRINYDFPVDREKWSGLVLVGEAPGAEETRLGHPFVGRSGQLLDKMLAGAEIDRRQCLVANVFRQQPPGNKVDHFFISRRAATLQNIAIDERFGKFGSAFCRAQFAPDIDNLRETLRDMKPKMVIALGRTPLWALTGEGSLLQKVGTCLNCSLVPGLSVMPTYHPSFILRGNWGLQDQWLSHFVAAKNA